MKEKEMDSVLEDLRSRLLRSRIQNTLAQTPEILAQSQTGIFLPLESSSVVRSEQFINPDDLNTIESGIERTREVVFAKGQPFTSHPDVLGLVNDDIMTFEETNETFWIENSDFTVYAARKPFSHSIGDKLYLCVQEPMVDVTFGSYFDGTFKLDVELQVSDEQKRKPLMYGTSRRLMTEMPEIDGRIVRFYIQNILGRL